LLDRKWIPLRMPKSYTSSTPMIPIWPQLILLPLIGNPFSKHMLPPDPVVIKQGKQKILIQDDEDLLAIHLRTDFEN
ncbi:MAG: hypothetical protein J6S85_21615, partial [Methanobrevibacter sp.]|nr:hypothetical protein [Methanobrevibacter sp.]